MPTLLIAYGNQVQLRWTISDGGEQIGQYWPNQMTEGSCHPRIHLRQER